MDATRVPATCADPSQGVHMPTDHSGELAALGKRLDDVKEFL